MCVCRRQSSTIQASLKNLFDPEISERREICASYCVVLSFVFIARVLFCRRWRTCPSFLTKNYFLICRFNVSVHQILMICGLLDTGTWCVCCHFFLLCAFSPHEIFKAIIEPHCVHNNFLCNKINSISPFHFSLCFVLFHLMCQICDKSYMLMLNQQFNKISFN